jgi:hypothetical protein
VDFLSPTVLECSASAFPLSLDGSAKIRRDKDYANVCDVLCPRTRRLTSTDGRTTVLKPRPLGKKIGQRKRKINERTTTFKKKKTYDE